MATRTAYDSAAVERLAREVVPVGAKGWPPEAEGLPSGALGERGWRVLDGDLPFPVLVLRERALARNLELMRAFCERNGALLAPHGKTTMAPQLFARQLDAGAWGLTAATPAHLRVYRAFGIERIVLANQLVEAGPIRWLARELADDPAFELACLVDSVAGVRLLERELAATGSPRPLSVLVEVGMPGMRTGTRTLDEGVEVGRAVAGSAQLRLAGVEGFEGLAADVGGVDAFLAELDELRVALEREALIAHGGEGTLPSLTGDANGALVSAGGSAYFDRVVERFAGRPLLLRGGCYLTHDDGFYEHDSPLAGRSDGALPRLENAIEIWSVVLSRPEPELAITSMGKRDCAYDLGLPTPTLASELGGTPRPLRGEVLKLSDQHAHVRVDPSERLAVGDLVACTISHPCTALDKWRLVAVVDDDHRVVDAVHTFF